MRKTAVIYIAFCISLGLGLLVFLSIRDFNYLSAVLGRRAADIIPGILFLSALAAIAESQSFAIDESKALSIAFAVSFSALIIYGAGREHGWLLHDLFPLLISGVATRSMSSTRRCTKP